jgi:hypothetical protein
VRLRKKTSGTAEGAVRFFITELGKKLTLALAAAHNENIFSFALLRAGLTADAAWMPLVI